MKYTSYFENFLDLDSIKLNLKNDLVYPDFSVKKAYSNILNKKLSYSKNLPILVSYYKDINKYMIEDGWHRVIQLILLGKREIVAQVKYSFNNINYGKFIKINWNNPKESFEKVLKDETVKI